MRINGKKEWRERGKQEKMNDEKGCIHDEKDENRSRNQVRTLYEHNISKSDENFNSITMILMIVIAFFFCCFYCQRRFYPLKWRKVFNGNGIGVPLFLIAF